MLIYGINPVLEALRAGRVRVVRVAAPRPRPRARASATLADARGVPRARWSRADDLDRAARGGVHQGVVAELADAPGLLGRRNWSRRRTGRR